MDYKNIDNIIVNLNRKIHLLKKHKKVVSYNEKQLNKLNNLLRKKNIIMEGGNYNDYSVKVNEGLIVLNYYAYLMYNVQLLEMYKMYNKLRDKLYDILMDSINKLNEKIPDKPTVTIELLDIILKKLGELHIKINRTKDTMNQIGPVKYSEGTNIYYKDKKDSIDELLNTIREEVNKAEFRVDIYARNKNNANHVALLEISELRASIATKTEQIRQLSLQIENAKSGQTLKQ
jgi:hypothetical protein